MISRALKNIASTPLLLALLVSTAPRLEADPQKSGPSTNWTTVDENTFTLDLPVEMKKIPTQGIDSQVGRYESKDIQINFDFGLYSDPLIFSAKPFDYKEKKIVIDGRRAKLVSYTKSGVNELITAVHFPTVSSYNGITMKLTIYGTCKRIEDRPTLETILRSVRFSKTQKRTISN